MPASIDLLRMLVSTHAFDPMPLPGYRTSLYVPFESLVPGSYESRLVEELRRLERVSVIGTVGSGKSSLIEHVLDQATPGLAPLLVSASHEDERTLIDHVEFARHMIREIVGWARDVEAMTEREQRAARANASTHYPQRSTIRTQTVGVKLALKWLEPSWSRQLQELLPDPDVERGRGEFVESLSDLVEFVYEVGRTPVVVIDDSDRWLRLEPAARTRLMDGFFGETSRMLAEKNWAVVMAIHPEYCAETPFREAAARGYLSSQLAVPHLPDTERLMALLRERVQRRIQDESGPDEPTWENVSVHDVFEEGCGPLMFERYQSTDGDLRKVLTAVHQALAEAIRGGDDFLRVALLEETILALA